MLFGKRTKKDLTLTVTQSDIDGMKHFDRLPEWHLNDRTIIKLKYKDDSASHVPVVNVNPASGVHQTSMYRLSRLNGQTANFDVPMGDISETDTLIIWVYHAETAERIRVIQDGIVSHIAELPDFIGMLNAKGDTHSIASGFKLVFNRPRFGHLNIELEFAYDTKDGTFTIYREVTRNTLVRDA